MTTEEYKQIKKEIDIIQERIQRGLETQDDKEHLEALRLFCINDPFVATHEFSEEDNAKISVASKIFTDFVRESKMNAEYLAWICVPTEDAAAFMKMSDDCEVCHSAAITTSQTDTDHHPWDPPVFSYKVKYADEICTALTPDGIWYRDDEDVWCFLSIGTAKHMVAALSRDDKFQTFEKIKEKAEQQKEQERMAKELAKALRGKGKGRGKGKQKGDQVDRSDDPIVLDLQF